MDERVTVARRSVAWCVAAMPAQTANHSGAHLCIFVCESFPVSMRFHVGVVGDRLSCLVLWFFLFRAPLRAACTRVPVAEDHAIREAPEMRANWREASYNQTGDLIHGDKASTKAFSGASGGADSGTATLGTLGVLEALSDVLTNVTFEACSPWIAIIVAWMGFGSVAVPMKFEAVVNAEVHPMVFQLHRTFWTYATSHLALVVVPYRVSSWGLLSGLSWVPAGIASNIAVRHLGIAYGQALWQTTIIITSFVWGCCILKDTTVKSVALTAIALSCLIGGVVGMALAFNAVQDSEECDDANVEFGAPSHTSEDGRDKGRRRGLSDVRNSVAEVTATTKTRSTFAGISAALFNGIWGGSNLVPASFAPYKGIDFVMSFVSGAMVVNILLFAGYVMLCKCRWKQDVPPMHFRIMLLPGFLTGLLWAVANFCSLYAVSKLGQAIGYSLVQSSVVVSGLWGIAFFGEMRGSPVFGWTLSCALCLSGTVLLGLQKS